MLKTIREEKVGKVRLRLLKDGEEYVGVIMDDKPLATVRGEDPDQVWAKLRAEVGKVSPAYFGYGGARGRFLRLFPGGFAGAPFQATERNYKVDASDYLRAELPLEAARSATPDMCEIAARAFSKTNMLSPFENARTRDVLKSPDGAAFISAAAALAEGDRAPALSAIEKIFRPRGTPSWPAATYLPFLWKPESRMFLKPEVTKDFAERVGHPFAWSYQSALKASVDEELHALAAETQERVADLGPRDLIDIQSFIWIVGAYQDADAPAG